MSFALETKCEIISYLGPRHRTSLALVSREWRTAVMKQYAIEFSIADRVQELGRKALQKTDSPEEGCLIYRKTLSELRTFLKLSLDNPKLPKYIKSLIEDFLSSCRPVIDTFSDFDKLLIPFGRMHCYNSINKLLPTTKPLAKEDLCLESFKMNDHYLILQNNFSLLPYKKSIKEGYIDCEAIHRGESLLITSVKSPDMEGFDLALDLGANIDTIYTDYYIDYEKVSPRYEKVSPLLICASTVRWLRLLQHLQHSQQIEIKKNHLKMIIKLIENGANLQVEGLIFNELFSFKQFITDISKPSAEDEEETDPEIFSLKAEVIELYHKKNV